MPDKRNASNQGSLVVAINQFASNKFKTKML